MNAPWSVVGNSDTSVGCYGRFFATGPAGFREWRGACRHECWFVSSLASMSFVGAHGAERPSVSRCVCVGCTMNCRRSILERQQPAQSLLDMMFLKRPPRKMTVPDCSSPDRRPAMVWRIRGWKMDAATAWSPAAAVVVDERSRIVFRHATGGLSMSVSPVMLRGQRGQLWSRRCRAGPVLHLVDERRRLARAGTFVFMRCPADGGIGFRYDSRSHSRCQVDAIPP